MLGDFADSTSLILPDENEGEGEDDTVDYIRFGEDHTSWRWVVGLYQSQECVRFVRVPNRKTETLLAVIAAHCEEGSHIDTDGWAAYNALQDHGYVHRVVVHDRNYVDPETGAHTQAIERQWLEVRAWLRKSRGNRTHLQSHMDEISWRALHRDKKNDWALLDQLIVDIMNLHSVQV